MPQVLPLRAHMVLCLLGFRGEGYSVTFVAEMTAVHRQLKENPEQLVQLLISPDRICRACVHLRHGGCRLGGPEHEIHMRAQDKEVVTRLGLAPGGIYPWSVILNRIRQSIQGKDLEALCTTCPWLELGYCAESIDALRGPESIVADPASETADLPL